MTNQKINFELGIFKGGSGTIYYLQPDKVFPKRYEVYEELSLKAGFGSGFSFHFSNYKKIYTLLTDGNNVLTALRKASEIAYQAMLSTKELKEEKHSHVLHLVALFCNAEDEDITQYDDRVMSKKILDFKESGILISDFFLLLRNLIEGFAKSLTDITQIEKEREKETESQKNNQKPD